MLYRDNLTRVNFKIIIMSLYESRRIPKENKRLQLLWVVLHHVAMFISYYVNDITVKIVSAKCELT